VGGKTIEENKRRTGRGMSFFLFGREKKGGDLEFSLQLLHFIHLNIEEKERENNKVKKLIYKC
jgi:hypothetical protein